MMDVVMQEHVPQHVPDRHRSAVEERDLLVELFVPDFLQALDGELVHASIAGSQEPHLLGAHELGQGVLEIEPPLHHSVADASVDLESLIRRVIREECGITAVTPAEKWRGGTLVLRPGTPGLQEKSLPIETFFHKIVMLRNRLRSLEQQVNAAELPEDVKLKLQGYVTGCYGSLTSFNVLFADEDDQFKGGGGD